MVRNALRPVRAAIVLAALSAGPGAFAGGRVGWPAPTHGAGDASDPIASARWGAESWVSAAPGRYEALLEELAQRARQQPNAAQWVAERAVLLRVMGRVDDARTTLARATAMDPRVMDDPDVALTAAFLAAREGRFEQAVAFARTALPRMDVARDRRAELAVEIARWSMARGAPGLPSAIGVLREVSAYGPPERMVLATLSLALVRDGKVDEAREVARSGALPMAFEALTRRAGMIPGEADAAVGTALVLAGRGHEAIEPLVRAAETVLPPWRALASEYLAQARRAPSGGAVSGPLPPRSLGRPAPTPPHPLW